MTVENWFLDDDVMGADCVTALKIKAKLHEEQSPFQKIAIYDTEKFGHLMTIDGVIMLTARDNFFYHEMLAHPALFIHDNPRDILIIGGGDCGTLREVLKHSDIEKVTQVEIDERVTALATRYFPELCAANGDARARLLFEDGIAWVQNAPDASLDVIIIDSTDPVGPAEGLFNAPFYAECRRVLRPDGVLVQQSESPFLHFDTFRATGEAMRAVGFTETQALLFPQCVYPSGLWSATLARSQPLTKYRTKDAEQKPFDTMYYSAEIHAASLVLPPFLRG